MIFTSCCCCLSHILVAPEMPGKTLTAFLRASSVPNGSFRQVACNRGFRVWELHSLACVEWWPEHSRVTLWLNLVNSPFSALLREACRLNLAVFGKCLEILLGLNGSHSLLIWADHLSQSKTCPLVDEHHHYSLKTGRVPYSHHDMPPPPHGHYFKACHSSKSILLPPMLHSAPSPNSTSLMSSVNTFPF